jgi:hypothetical protein
MIAVPWELHMKAGGQENEGWEKGGKKRALKPSGRRAEIWYLLAPGKPEFNFISQKRWRRVDWGTF